MDALARAAPAALRTGLLPLADGYEAWLDERAAGINDLPASLRAPAEAAVFTARQASARVRAGIDLLTDPGAPRHGEALAAFRFANRAMALQRRHTDLVRLREHGLAYAEAQARIDERGPAAASWRPFQLAFVLLNLPSLTEPTHPERAADHDATVDLLFFPTGGGKTEAYLGLTAFTFAIRRLQGALGSGAEARSGAAGTAVLMRYTLRLLTAQQFQRAAALVCAAEVLRQEEPTTWGGAVPDRPVGRRRRVPQLVSGGGRSDRRGAGGRRGPAHQRAADPGLPLVRHRPAPAPRPGPPGRAAPGAAVVPPRRGCRRLPVLPHPQRRRPAVDEEIYRYAPSLVIATVDKLAQLPWRGEAGTLFGRVRQPPPAQGRAAGGDQPAGDPAAPTRPDHPGRAAP